MTICADPSAILRQEQKQKEAVQLDSFISYNEALIDERDQGIAELGQQISDVHEMFQVRPWHKGCRSHR